MNHHAINTAVQFLIKRGYQVPPSILSMQTPKTSQQKAVIALYIKKAKKEADEYGTIRNEFWASVYDAVYDYLDSSKPVTTYKQKMAMALSRAYIQTSERAWLDGGAELPIEGDIVQWGKAEISAQLSYVDSLFETLKALRKEDDVDGIHEAFARADGYADALDGFYNAVKVAGYGGRMLTFTGSDGRESCYDCKRLKGKRKRASWWISHELVPPSRMFECKGYNCDHYLIDDNGNVFTV